jgi:hypothetical protein
METQIVRSYVRGGKQVSNEAKTENNGMALVLGGSALLIAAVVYWYIAAPVALLGITGYAVAKLAPIQAVKEIQALRTAENTPKPKRHYQHRLKVHMYDTGKTVRV